MPLPPSRFDIIQIDEGFLDVTVYIVFDPPVESGPVDYYEVTIVPKPLSQPTSTFVYFTPWNVTLDFDVEYTASVISVNCFGKSLPLVKNISFSK